MLVENTSSYYISPDLYRQHNGPHVKDFVDAMHGAGKLAFIHMCGHVKALLPQFKGIGFDGIHTLTPPPTGDTPWELALDVLGEELVIIGALPPPAWITCPVAEIPAHLERYYTPRLRRAHFLLAPMADGIPVAPERFQAIGDWIARHPRG
jgi:uroporphyrinogen-III decarboxylase